MDTVYSKESLLFMLEEIQEDLELLNKRFLEEQANSRKLVNNHMKTLEKMEESMNIFEKKVDLSCENNKYVLSKSNRRVALHLNLAK
ncbi:MAG TPA: hypothetical protein VNR61_12395 [Niallia sp.]|nr:hypothetical protein [Niallia sp.]